ncbi:hypothetical protein SDJN03_13053, partial [Cucurbita argyrosperma subsp. sororia]
MCDANQVRFYYGNPSGIDEGGEVMGGTIGQSAGDPGVGLELGGAAVDELVVGDGESDGDFGVGVRVTI